MKALKWIGIAAGSLVLLLSLAVGGLYLFFDPTSLKPQIEKYVQDSKQRKLTIDGPIKLTVFPSIGVALGKTTLSEKSAPAQFLAFENATLSVKVLPLLASRVEVSKVRIDGLQLAVRRDAKGVLNFDDLLTKEPAAQSSSAATPMAFDIEGVQLTNALVDIRDEKTKTVGKLSNLNFKNGRLTPGIPTDLDFSGNVLLSEPKTDAKVAIKGGFLLDQERNMVELTKARITVDGTAGPMSKTQLAIDAGFINVDTRTDAVNAKDLVLDVKGDYTAPAAGGKGPSTQVRELALLLKSPQAFLSLGDQILTGDKIDLAAKGKLNNEPFDVAVKAPKLRADIPKLELVANDLDAKIIGTFGGNSANLKIAGKEVDAKLSDNRVKVGGLRVEGSAKVGGNDLSKLDLRVPSLNANLAASTLTAQGIKLDAAGTYGGKTGAGDALTISLDAPSLSLASGATKSAPITGKATVKGKQNLDADFRIDGLAAAGDQWSAQSTAINYNASLEGRSSTGKLTTGFSFNPKQDVLSLSNLALDAQVKDPSLPGGAATTALKGNVSLSPRAGKVTVKLAGLFEQSKVDLDATVSNFAKPNAVFTASIDKLDADRYITKTTAKPVAGGAAPAPAAKDAPVDLSALKNMSGNGTLRIGELKVANVRTSNVNLAVKLANGRADIGNANLGLYSGTAQASGFVDANTNAMALKANLAGVSVLPLLKDAIDKDILEGKGTVVVDLSTKGATVDALKRGLAGTINLNLKDGSVKGINLAQQLRDFRGKLQLGKNDGGSAKKSEKTDFSEMSGMFTANNGVLTASDVKLASPFLRATQGTPANIDLVGEKLDFVVRATLVNTSTGQEGKTSGLKDLTIPVRLSGPFTAPGYDIQWSAVSSEAVKAALAPKIEEKKEQLKDKLKDQLGAKLGISPKDSKPAEAAPGATPSPAPTKKPEDALKDKLKGLLGR